MSLTLELAQTVAIGAFNPHIITPDWLVRYEICPEEDLSVHPIALGEGSAFCFGNVEWQVDYQRLGVTSFNSNVDCGGMVSRVLSRLPHTPIQAVGHNFHFTGAKDDWTDRPSPMLGTRGLGDFEGAEQVQWVGAFRREASRLEVTVAYEAGAVAILFNHQRNMDLEQARRARSPEEQIAQARAAAEQFREDFEISREWLRSFFGMELPE